VSRVVETEEPLVPAGVPTKHGVPKRAGDALDVYGEVYVSSSHSSRSVVHIHPRCTCYPAGGEGARALTHRGELPLSVDDVCSWCQEHATDADGRLRPAVADGEFVDRHPRPRRVCGVVNCRRDGLVQIDHADHGTRVVCPRHQRRHPVEEVFG